MSEILNNTPIEHRSKNGLVFKSENGDLRTGVTVEESYSITADAIFSDIVEFGAWHAMQIRPNLNGFSGYDCIKYALLDKKPEPEVMIFKAQDRSHVEFLDNNSKSGKRRTKKEWE
jgi:hypothetical protein